MLAAGSGIVFQFDTVPAGFQAALNADFDISAQVVSLDGCRVFLAFSSDVASDRHRRRIVDAGSCLDAGCVCAFRPDIAVHGQANRGGIVIRKVGPDA